MNDSGRIVEVVVTNGKVWKAQPDAVLVTQPNGLVTGICIRVSPTRTLTIPAASISGIIVEYANSQEIDQFFEAHK